MTVHGDDGWRTSGARFGGRADLVSKAERLQASDDERRTIGRAARDKVLLLHRLEPRFERILAGLERRGFA